MKLQRINVTLTWNCDISPSLMKFMWRIRISHKQRFFRSWCFLYGSIQQKKALKYLVDLPNTWSCGKGNMESPAINKPWIGTIIVGWKLSDDVFNMVYILKDDFNTCLWQQSPPWFSAFNHGGRKRDWRREEREIELWPVYFLLWWTM